MGPLRFGAAPIGYEHRIVERAGQGEQGSLVGLPGRDGGAGERTITTSIPARLDRLPWSRWHWMVLIGLGTVWILDGLEVTIVGAVGPTLTSHGSGISISSQGVGYAAATYILGACIGALVFGHLTDRFGRKRLFLVTLGLYLVATVFTASSVNVELFCVFRFFTGMGIGGEYAAINSAIDELIPARVRGTVDLIVNGSYWLGTAAGAAATIALLDPNLISTDLGWRVCFFMGAILGLGVLFVRRGLPESPRWLLTHGHAEDAEAVVDGIEEQVRASSHHELEEPDDEIELSERPPVTFVEVAKVVFGSYPRRSIVGLSLFIGQAFLYNAVFFTFGLVLTTFYKVANGSVGYYLIAFAIGNFLGPLLLGRLFDVVGRRAMIGGCYVASGVMLAVTARLFDAGVLSATTQTVAWAVIFFFASAGASAAYLTVSEVFPMETRALAIAFFYAVGTGIGGIVGPSLFGNLVATGHPFDMSMGYVLAAGLMVAGGVVEIALGVDAERKSLEEVAAPLSAASGGDAGARDGGAATREGTERHDLRGLPLRHRYPIGGPASWTPLPRQSAPSSDRSVLRQSEAVVELLEREGPLSYRELAQRTEHRLWGPGRLWAALRIGVASGRIARDRSNRYVATGRRPSRGVQAEDREARRDDWPGRPAA